MAQFTDMTSWVRLDWVAGSAALLSAVGTIGCGPSGAAPRLDPIEDKVVAVGEQLTFRVVATDDDGDSLSYSFESDVVEIHQRAFLTLRPDRTAWFSWSPVAVDVGVHTFDFSVSDGERNTSTTVTIEVVDSLNSAPVFLKPAGEGTALDLSDKRSIIVEVEVTDPDDTSVTIEAIEPIVPGSLLEQVTDFTARWTWAPSDEQIAASDIYQVTFAATDSDNQTTKKRFTIVLRAGSDRCDSDGLPPVVVHMPQNFSTVNDKLRFEAEITDDIGITGMPLFSYSLMDPGTPPSFNEMTTVFMDVDEGNRWKVDIDNPVRGMPAGSSQQIFYFIAVADADGGAGTCHITQHPQDDRHEITVTSAGIGCTDTCGSGDTRCEDGAEFSCEQTADCWDWSATPARICDSGVCANESVCLAESCPSESPTTKAWSGFALRVCEPDGATRFMDGLEAALIHPDTGAFQIPGPPDAPNPADKQSVTACVTVDFETSCLPSEVCARGQVVESSVCGDPGDDCGGTCASCSPIVRFFVGDQDDIGVHFTYLGESSAFGIACLPASKPLSKVMVCRADCPADAPNLLVDHVFLKP